MTKYKELIKELKSLKDNKGSTLGGIDPEHAARMRLQNRFSTGLEIAKYTSNIMHADMKEYDKDPSKYTQSLGCWHGFIAQQMVMAVKKYQKTTAKSYVYLSGWMVAALRSEFGPLPDQSMHEKTAVPSLINEIYTFLKQADASELQHLFIELDEARKKGENEDKIIQKIDNFETHVVPLIADIDAGFGNEEATYLLAKKMIEAGALQVRKGEGYDSVLLSNEDAIKALTQDENGRLKILKGQDLINSGLNILINPARQMSEFFGVIPYLLRTRIIFWSYFHLFP